MISIRLTTHTHTLSSRHRLPDHQYLLQRQQPHSYPLGSYRRRYYNLLPKYWLIFDFVYCTIGCRSVANMRHIIWDPMYRYLNIISYAGLAMRDMFSTQYEGYNRNREESLLHYSTLHHSKCIQRREGKDTPPLPLPLPPLPHLFESAKRLKPLKYVYRPRHTSRSGPTSAQ